MIYFKFSWVLLILSFCCKELHFLEYCKLCTKGTHTLCKYKEGPSDNCVEYKKLEFAASVKKYVVDIHNDIRNHVASGQETRGVIGRQPAASNMNSLQWDNELAEIAQRWADQCIPLEEVAQHDQCRKTERFEVSQNVLTALTPIMEVPEIAILILNWYKQVENVLPSDIENFSGIQRGRFLIGQYTQLIWANTRFIGCGMSTFRNKNLTNPNAKYLHRLVCNYGPRGNLIGSPVYKLGIPCSQCPYGRCDTVRTSLCEAYGPYKTTSTTIKSEQSYVEIPTSLFNTISLEYILKKNLTEILNGMLKKVSVVVGLEDLEPKPKENFNSLSEIISLLPSLLPNMTSSELEELIRKPVTTKPIKERNWLKKTSNVLYQANDNQNVYALEAGQIIVHDCRSYIFQCQYEEEEPVQTGRIQGDITLPNHLTYRKAEGVWFHGRCRCDYVFRSNQSGLRYCNFVIFGCILLVAIISVPESATPNWVRMIGSPKTFQRYFDGDTCNCLYRIE